MTSDKPPTEERVAAYLAAGVIPFWRIAAGRRFNGFRFKDFIDEPVLQPVRTTVVD